MLKQNITPAPNVKIMFNIGALLDIPTGIYVTGYRGEHILLGGLGMLTGVTGIGNNFKSTTMHYMMLSAVSRLRTTVKSIMDTYDTEINMHEDALRRFTQAFESFIENDPIDDGTWLITDRTIYFANKWFELKKEFMESKVKDAKDITITTPFMARDKTPMKILLPTFTEIDSFSRFETEAANKMQEDNELGDSGGNTIHMRMGLDKTRFLMALPTLAGRSMNFFLLAAHLGKDSAIPSGPYAAPPTKKLQYLKHGDKMKGVTDQFTFLMSNCWHAHNAAPLINQGTKGPEYPRDPDDNEPGDKDLNIVTLVQLRGKSGPTGFTLDLIVSQSEGVLPTLTEFHFIRTHDYYGLNGSKVTYELDLYPGVKLTRPSVRSKINTDKKLQRAINITSELLQMHQYYRTLNDILCTPKELYDGLVKHSFDMDYILEHTRGWWCPEDDNHPLVFMSTKDLLLAAKGEYIPYWMNSDKTIKDKYKR